MSREIVNAYCRTLPGAEHSDPWGGGHDAWKVGGKLFAVVGSQGEGVSVKTPSVEDAAMLIDMGRAVRAPYFHRSWVRVDWSIAAQEEIRERLHASYRIVRAGLTRAQRAALEPVPPPPMS
ncbi:MmcQ/YjbR family DNA-binding protein [Histidinibacterium aquaticum]|uniref:MmcQ/YjbR family DNA-binding protein n=1 Tax=Histidinibacterium aquaticum TaxID=2613962 RepID=A0A5J5GMK6_9RHOB|nr:MmcQ/YjbR family DNA-binding protein [Histidinibacterium aquaticum]KAA9008923.1 MmcQ/YjbR family DNA-binding protein [Histidinibacterium aquaticum]